MRQAVPAAPALQVGSPLAVAWHQLVPQNDAEERDPWNAATAGAVEAAGAA